jgi:tetratricopeptide (TPR) repeat protein
MGAAGILLVSTSLLLLHIHHVRDLPYRYPFEQPQRSQATQQLMQEIAFYRQRLQLDPESGLHRALLAQTYIAMARATGETSWYLLAEQTAQESLAKLPFSNDGALLALARVNLAKHDFPQAIQMARQVTDTASALPTLIAANLAIGETPLAHQQAETLANQSPSLSAFTLRGLTQFAQGQDQQAIADFQRAIDQEEAGEAGGSVYVRTLLGRLYLKRGKLDVAEQLYRESLRVLPNYEPALLNLAELQVRRGHYHAAQKTYDRFFFVARQAPTTYDHTALRGIARVHALQGNPQAATQWWERAEARLRQEMSTFGHRRELAQLLLERGRPQDLQEALILMKAEVKLRRDAETWSTLAETLGRLGRWAEAKQALRSALASGVRDAGLFRQMGQIESHLGQQKAVQRWMQRATEVDPTYDARAENAQGLGVGLLGLA